QRHRECDYRQPSAPDRERWSARPLLQEQARRRKRSTFPKDFQTRGPLSKIVRLQKPATALGWPSENETRPRTSRKEEIGGEMLYPNHAYTSFAILRLAFK